MKLRVALAIMLCVSLQTAMAHNNFSIKKAQSGATVFQNRQGRVIAYMSDPIDRSNPGLNWWLSSVERLPAKAMVGIKTTTPASLGFPSRCEPLLTTNWGQDAPYSWMCPEPGYLPWAGYRPDVPHCPTGCVATATAQIMKYFGYPLHGTGTSSVNPEQQEGTTVYTVDHSLATYRWDLMLDDYVEGEYTTEQAQAVAELCYHVGVASLMGYREDASATDNYYAILALQEHFGYATEGVESVDRNNYSESDWMKMVYTELSEGRPILYEALGIDLGNYGIYGHSFVIDGYDEAGLVHVNWGWYGRHNGFYDIALLNPIDLQFDAYQMMATGIRPKSIVGDFDGDGTVTAADITAIYNYLLSNDTTFLSTSDVDGDGTVTSADVTLIYNILLGN